MSNSAEFGVMFVVVSGFDFAFGLAGTVHDGDVSCVDNDFVSTAMDSNCVVLFLL